MVDSKTLTSMLQTVIDSTLSGTIYIGLSSGKRLEISTDTLQIDDLELASTGVIHLLNYVGEEYASKISLPSNNIVYIDSEDRALSDSGSVNLPNPMNLNVYNTATALKVQLWEDNVDSKYMYWKMKEACDSLWTTGERSTFKWICGRLRLELLTGRVYIPFSLAFVDGDSTLPGLFVTDDGNHMFTNKYFIMDDIVGPNTLIFNLGTFLRNGSTLLVQKSAVRALQWEMLPLTTINDKIWTLETWAVERAYDYTKIKEGTVKFKIDTQSDLLMPIQAKEVVIPFKDSGRGWPDVSLVNGRLIIRSDLNDIPARAYSMRYDIPIYKVKNVEINVDVTVWS